MDQIEVIKDIIVSNCDWIERDNIRVDSTFGILGFDSMDIASIMLGIEDHYSIKISNVDVRNLDTIEKISNYLIINNLK